MMTVTWSLRRMNAHNAYDASGFCNEYVKSEDFPDLKPGKNHIAWSGAIDHVEITPRWWTL